MPYSPDELNLLKNLFDTVDPERTGRIHINQLPVVLARLGKNEDEVVNITEAASRIADENEGQITFDDFIRTLENLESQEEIPFEGPDPKVIEFLRILEDYRTKCEEEGNYLEAGRAFKQLSILRKQEEKRQQKAIKARQISERQDVQLAHNMQFSDFNSAWDKYLEEYDNMAQMYIQQMTERHALILLEFQKTLRNELMGKPPKWSRELLESRRRQHICARNKNYAEAQKLKKVCDRIEEKERKELEEGQAIIFARREAKFRQQQQVELQALLKRIECRRKEHIKQRNLDSKRLLQRNRNVQAVLESKQNSESTRIFNDIKKALQSNSYSYSSGPPTNQPPAGSGVNVAKKNKKGNSNNMQAYDKEEIDYGPPRDEINFENMNGDIDIQRPDFGSLVYDEKEYND